jgi:hypothetical protein
MSVLETPRIVFRGRITWDPIVTNNSAKYYDEVASHTVFRPGETVASFRAAAIAAVTSGGLWNVHGTHRSMFYETRVVSVDVGKGPSTDDPFVLAPVSLMGMLVDLEPYGAFSSQLFFDAMSFGIEGGCRVVAPRHTRMTDRYINFARNSGYAYIAGGASVVWQTSFPKRSGLRVDAHGSPALEALGRALADDDVLGLTVRWNAYLTSYYDSLDMPAQSAALSKALQQKLEGGGFQPNPARSELVGVLGLWRKGEPGSVPGDRSLVTQRQDIGSAWARVSTHQVTIDLSNSIPETGVDLQKTKLGDLTLVAVDDQGKPTPLGTFTYAAYDREAYDRTAGLVTVPVDPGTLAKVARQDFELRTADGTVLLREEALRACPEEPNIYLDQGDDGAIRVLALDRGVPAGSVMVTLADTGASAPSSRTVTTDAHGSASFEIEGKRGRIDEYVLVVSRPGGPPPVVPEQIDPQVNDFVYVRTLPADGRIARLPPTWDNVHRHVLANWEAMAPCMDNWLRLGDPARVKAFAAVLRRLTDRDNFEAFRFMPVTRDLTQGQRTLLWAWLDLDEKATAKLAVAPARAEPEALSIRAKSRALRGGE